ncbi:hypothetical protein E2C01_076346 [Portunus trituberculatus]|uniref:Uncharacterized protein n=1 Tax=Portunus trituberculatus TaxID=210409 RepID=A0A5B7IHL0_PORTR|nr:hypothetical protein [Portunus trituberculatus]
MDRDRLGGRMDRDRLG